jgi:hypothetical protein
MIILMGASMDDSVLAFSKEKFIEVLKPIFGKHVEKAYNELHGITTENTEIFTQEDKGNIESEPSVGSVEVRKGKRKDN